jgi:serine/threonine protein kinase/WD40 repeat protein/Tfp pilus assembly protein PilF
LRARVEALLRVHDEERSFLRPPAAGPDATLDDRPAAEGPGTVIGPYKLLEQIGEGGFGVVFMAEQQRPIRRLVALKVLKPGMDTRQVVARFEAERQALALMDHPNIARVFDGGETVGGRPFFVMELVKGIPITDYGEQNRLTLRQRLELFVHVCQAIQHAHHKGIIHRDLKPSNVLVTLHDGVPVVKVIDFGIAKALGQQLTDKTLVTGFAQLVGTPLYMSPEQAELSGLDIDTRTDIYSLGMLLYELLTGTTPFARERLRSAGYDDIRRMIREEEPPRPSARISTRGRTATGVSAQRQGDAKRLSRLFRGELDWIVMKALEKDRGRRFETASAFAADVQRYLSDEPVHACPPSAWYRLRKFARRNKAGALMASSVALGILLAIAGLVSAVLVQAASNARIKEEQKHTTAALADSNEQRQRAQAEKRKANENLSKSLLAQAQARRWSGRVGQRFESLQAVAEAARIARELGLGEAHRLALRNEAIACLALADVRLVREWPGYPPGSRGPVAFDANLERYARGDSKGAISVRRVAGDRELARLPGPGIVAGHMKFSPDSDFLAVRYSRLPGRSTNFVVWDWRRRAPAFEPSFPVTDAAAAFTPDGRQLMLGQEGGTLLLYEVRTWRKVKRLVGGCKPANLSFHPDGSKLAVGGTYGERQVQVRDLATGNFLRALPHPDAVTRVAWHPDGNRLATACSDSHVYLWDLTTGRQAAVLQGHQGSAIGVTFAPAGDLLVSRSWDGTGRLWDPWTGRHLVSFGGEAIALSRDGRWLASRNGARLGVWEVASGREYRTLPNPAGAAAHSDGGISPDGRWLVAAGNRGVGLWDLAAGQERALLPVGSAEAAVFHPSGRAFFTGGRAGLYHWPVRVGSGTLRVGPPRKLAAGPFQRVALDQQGRVLAAVGGHGGLIVSLDSPLDQARRFAHVNAAFVATSPDGRWVASGTWNGFGVKVWHAGSGQLARDLLPAAPIASVAFSPDGRWLVTSTEDEFRLWEAGSWRPVRQISRRRGGGIPGCMAFSADGKVLALSPARDLVQLEDPATGRLFARLQAPNADPLGWLGFTPDGSQLAVVSRIRRGQAFVRVWDLRRVRGRLQALGLDWDLPPYAPRQDAEDPQPTPVQVDLGEFTPLRVADEPRRQVGLASFVLALNPCNFQAYLRRGQAYARLGELQKAAEDYRTALAWMPEPNRRCAARFADRAANPATLREYIRALADALRDVEGNPMKANNRAWHHATGPKGVRDPVLALALAERALAQRPHDGCVLNTMGVVYYRLGWYEQARAMLQRSLRAQSAPAHDLFFLSMCAARRGDKEEARACHDRAVRWVEQRQGKLPAGWDAELAAFRAEAAVLLGLKEPRTPDRK